MPLGLVISADLIQVELATYIGDFRDSEFTWEVSEMAPPVFSVPFPSAELLWVCSHDFIHCPINKFLISVHAATAEPKLVPPLEKVWVVVYGLPRGGSAAPRGGKLMHILKAISEPVDKLVTMDLASFEDDGPARIEILCPAPADIDGLSLIFYFGSRGRSLTFELESPASVDLHGPTPAATVPGEDGRDGDGGSSEESSFCEEDDGDGGVLPTASDGRRTPVSFAAGPSGIVGVASRVASGIESVVLVGTSPVITNLVVMDGVEVLGGSSPVATTADDLELTEADVLSVGMEVCPLSSPRSSESPSSPALGSPDRVPPPPLDLVSSAVTPETVGLKDRGEASPVVSVRQSARLNQSRLLLDGRVPTIQEKATLRAAARDLSLEVATDSGIVFWGEKGPSWSRFPLFAPRRSLRGRWRKPVPMLRVVNPAPRRPLTLVIERPGVVRPPRW
ncbi:hypothetical protein D1007_42564 [Hordeum vulgare]|nr:hypothetical protein D1007_42564 [Hordeum vulgare]